MMLGQAEAITETVGGIRQIKQSALSSVQLLLGNRYAVLPGEGSPVLQVEGVTTLLALTPLQYQAATGSPPGGIMNAWEAIQNRTPGSYVLVDAQSVAQQLEGGVPPLGPDGLPQSGSPYTNDVPIIMYVAANRTLAQQLSLGSTAAVVAPLGGGASSTKEKTKGSGVAAGLAVGGVALVATGNPLVAAGAGIVTALVVG